MRSRTPTSSEGPSKTTVNHSKRGFSSVEVVIGAALMLILITSMLAMLKQGSYLVELSRDHTRVTQILQSEIEDLRTLNWTDLEDVTEWESFTPEGTFASTFADEYYCFRWIYETVTDQKEVFVMAVWFDSMNRSHVSYFRTRFTKEGLNDYYYRSV